MKHVTSKKIPYTEIKSFSVIGPFEGIETVTHTLLWRRTVLLQRDRPV